MPAEVVLQPRRCSAPCICGVQPAVRVRVSHSGAAPLRAAVGGQETTIDLLHEVFHQGWLDELDQVEVTVRHGKGEDENSLHETAHRMLEAFLASELAHLPCVIAVEETVTGQIHPDMPDLLARIDVVWQSEGQTHLIDLKTARSRWNAAKADESADQLLLYGQLAEMYAGDSELHLHFGVVTKAKSPAVQMLDVPCDSERITRQAEVMLPVWNAMKASVDYCNPSTMTCSTCPFQGRCPAKSGSSAVDVVDDVA